MKRRGRRRIEGANCRTSFLKSAERTLDVLEFLSKNRSVGITELADIVKIGTSSAHRILATLQKKGFAVQDPDTGRYALGHMVFQLTRSVMHMIEPVKYVRPHLDELCRKIGENIAFGVITPGKDRTLILAEEVADKAVIAKPILFQRFPIHVCPCGKAYLLTLDDRELKTVLSRSGMDQFTNHTLVTFSSLKNQLTQFHNAGYILSRDEFSVGLSAMGNGICNADGRFAGAIMIVGPSFRFTNKSVRYWGKVLQETTARLSLEFKVKSVI